MHGPLKFDFSDVKSKATLRLSTISSTRGTISAYRTVHTWDETSSWSDFVSDGVQSNNVEAVSVTSFTFNSPPSGDTVVQDLRDDVKQWLQGETNEGWCENRTIWHADCAYMFAGCSSLIHPTHVLSVVETRSSCTGWDFFAGEAVVQSPTNPYARQREASQCGRRTGSDGQ